ncbi:hypothetical protein DACRYDRAFT_24432 [Dacryopinax primogenitus]|uniref:Jacalin-type lectin domain-containing protein n=1 Tax=Dacryopinax primogenitus (strain DJM 731) TaxID=1858805 RepID=M5G3N1_DACPD|nr:uncharacterized protein DACRYDRAFT_24432 [Dacryopinax primogenitus]EJT98367.1 hypothetical protein DACRYDRAFT_24432 [Dacryopinax primogenitus]
MASNLTQTLSFGVHEGAAFNDATTLGGFPNTQGIKSIKQIRLMAGWLIDGMEVTYQMNDGSTKADNHLGTGKPNVTINFNDDEVLVCVTGKTTLPGYYQNKPYLCYLKFVIVNTASGNIRVEGPFGNGAGDAKYTGKTFSVAGPILAFAGQSISGNEPANALTLSFLKSEQLALGKGLQ